MSLHKELRVKREKKKGAQVEKRTFVHSTKEQRREKKGKATIQSVAGA